MIACHSKKKGLANYLRQHSHRGGIIICENPKFIYLKPAKTAGTSILREFLEKEISEVFHLKDHPEKAHRWFKEITDEKLQSYFIFCVVRNPFDRFVSLAAYFNIPFKKFIREISKYCEDDNIRIHSLPQSIYTHLNGYQFVDMICRFECLQADMNLVLDRIGLSRRILPYINKSRHSHYSEYYTDDEIELIEKLYADDIKYFGYSFEKAAASKSPKLKIKEKICKKLARIVGRFLKH
jgi:hypothetical protein